MFSEHPDDPDLVEPHPLSRKSVRKAGSVVRKFHRGECGEAAYQAALETIRVYRSGFFDPMETVNEFLRNIGAQVAGNLEVSSRLKKLPTIVNKLAERESTLDLSLMQDLGGCRVVFENFAQLRSFEQKFRSEFEGSIDHESDYIVSPRESGYRGKHLVVISSEHLIEVQLRTQIMHEWAVNIEDLSTLSRMNLKQDGTHLVQEFMKYKSRFDAHQEGLGDPLSDEEFDTFTRLKEEATNFLTTLVDRHKEDNQ